MLNIIILFGVLLFLIFFLCIIVWGQIIKEYEKEENNKVCFFFCKKSMTKI